MYRCNKSFVFCLMCQLISRPRASAPIMDNLQSVLQNNRNQNQEAVPPLSLSPAAASRLAESPTKQSQPDSVRSPSPAPACGGYVSHPLSPAPMFLQTMGRFKVMTVGQLLFLQSIEKGTCHAQRPHERNVTLETAVHNCIWHIGPLSRYIFTIFMRHVVDRSTARPHCDVPVVLFVGLTRSFNKCKHACNSLTKLNATLG